MQNRSSTLSVVIPASNEAATLPQLVARTHGVLQFLSRRAGSPELEQFEILVVDDGSTDQTCSILLDLVGLYPELRVLTLAAHMGQTAATIAGIRTAKGSWIATLDADLQNDPADLIHLWDALPGYDAALGWRVKRQDVWSKRVVSRWANRARNALLGQSIRDTGCSLRVFSRAAALRLPAFDGAHRFFGTLLLREGCRIVQVPVRHHPRLHGRSHYSFRNRSLRVVLDLIGVAWLMQRPVRYEVVEMECSGTIMNGASRGALVPVVAKQLVAVL
jgi:dolichol-phosphate mannosyltransferase